MTKVSLENTKAQLKVNEAAIRHQRREIAVEAMFQRQADQAKRIRESLKS